MKIALNVPPSTSHGWGIFALNLLLGWSSDPEIEVWFPDGQCTLDPLRRDALCKPVRWQMQDADVFIHGLGNGVLPELTTPPERTLGVIFFEEPPDAAAIARAQRYPLIITGSRWNEDLLRAAGMPRVRTVYQGVDRSLFHAAPSRGLLRPRFAVFSGGKAEHRKGQDIVLAAFRAFAATRPEAVLVTAWHSSWPELARSCDASGLAAPVVYGPRGLDVKGWAAATGINPDQVIDIGYVENTLMPQVYRECDCAVFPNRAEGGTNLVAMEAMACEVPTAVSRGTGHLDLAVPNLWIDPHDPVAGTLAAMEAFHASWRATGRAGRGLLSGFQWEDTWVQIKQACREVMNA